MASRGVNKVILIGNVGKDPEIRYFPSGDAVTNFSVATSEVWKDKNTGEPQERTEWHRVTVRGKMAEIVKQYVHKGSKVYCEGKLQTRKWQGQDGQDRYVTEVIVDITGSVQFLDPKGAGGASAAPYDALPSAPAGPGPAAGAPRRDPARAPDPYGEPMGGSPPMPDFDDDIPF